MWPFRKRLVSLADCGVWSGMTDYHCHLLPGVDDGVQTMEESLQILSLYEELGVGSVWITPHISEDYPNATKHLKQRFAQLQDAYDGRVTLHLASENMLDNLFEERLEKNDLLPMGKAGNYLLVETSFFNSPMGLNHRLLRIKEKGYIPVLAHPERYLYMNENDYHQLKSLHVWFQCNLPSLVGLYGKEVRKKAEWLLKEHMVDLWGTDTHIVRMLENVVDNRSLKPAVAEMLCK